VAKKFDLENTRKCQMEVAALAAANWTTEPRWNGESMAMSLGP
jgi:hypothetical protein